MRVSPRLATCLMACWLIVAVEPHCVGQTYQGKQLVKPELLADTTAVVPGKPFIVGLLLMNTLMCASAAGLFSAVLARPKALQAVTLATSAYSIVVGAIFLLGLGTKLPSLTS